MALPVWNSVWQSRETATVASSGACAAGRVALKGQFYSANHTLRKRPVARLNLKKSKQLRSLASFAANWP
jgi:hypothetical protein